MIPVCLQLLTLCLQLYKHEYFVSSKYLCFVCIFKDKGVEMTLYF